MFHDYLIFWLASQFFEMERSAQFFEIGKSAQVELSNSKAVAEEWRWAFFVLASSSSLNHHRLQFLQAHMIPHEANIVVIVECRTTDCHRIVVFCLVHFIFLGRFSAPCKTFRTPGHWTPVDADYCMAQTNVLNHVFSRP